MRCLIWTWLNGCDYFERCLIACRKVSWRYKVNMTNHPERLQIKSIENECWEIERFGAF